MYMLGRILNPIPITKIATTCYLWHILPLVHG